MVTFEDAMEIAIKEQEKIQTPDQRVVFTHARDCKDFWSISFCFEDSNGERYDTVGPKMHFDISKENGMLLDYGPYRPWNKYGIMYDRGKDIKIPDKYSSKFVI